MKYVVTESPPNGQTTFEKSCIVEQIRGATTVSTTTKKEATNGGEDQNSATSLDFGTTYQSGDKIDATCKVISTPGLGSPKDLYVKSASETMVAEDKIIMIIAS